MTDGLDLVTIFFKKAADVWYDENKVMQTGASLFNNMADGMGIPVCRMFSGGTQEASEGIVKMFAIDPSYSTSNYGIGSGYDYRGALLIELMLPSGAYGADAWKERKRYAQILQYCIEQAFTDPEPCIARFLIESISIDYMTQGDGKFDIFHTIKEVTNKKLTARVDVTALAWTGE